MTSVILKWFCFSCMQISSVVQSCPTMKPHESQLARLPCPSSTPGVYSNNVHQVSDAIQPSHPLSFPSLPSPNRSQHQGLFQWVNSLHEVAKVLSFSLSSVLPMNTHDWFPLGWTGWISLQSKGLSRVFNTTVQKHQFFGTQLSSQSNSHIHTWPQEKP